MNNSSISTQGNEKEPNMKLSELMAWSSAYGFVDVVILVGNVLTLTVFSTNKKLLRMRANYFLINLALADMMVGTFAMLMYLYHLIAAWKKGYSIWIQYSYKIYYIHFEITGGPCDLIGSNWCDLFTNRTIFCSKSHLFSSQ